MNERTKKDILIKELMTVKVQLAMAMAALKHYERQSLDQMAKVAIKQIEELNLDKKEC